MNKSVLSMQRHIGELFLCGLLIENIWNTIMWSCLSSLFRSNNYGCLCSLRGFVTATAAVIHFRIYFTVGDSYHQYVWGIRQLHAHCCWLGSAFVLLFEVQQVDGTDCHKSCLWLRIARAPWCHVVIPELRGNWVNRSVISETTYYCHVTKKKQMERVCT